MFDGRFLVDHAYDAAFAIDGNSKIVAWNYGAQRLMGHARREVLGRDCSKVLQAVYPDGEPLCGPSCEVANCFQKLKAFGLPSCRVRKKDDSWVSVCLSTIVMPKGDGDAQSRSVIAVVILRAEEDEGREQPMARTLQISTLGRFRLTAGGRRLAVEKWTRKQALTLLKYLAANLGRPVHREILMEFFWPGIDEERAWKRLKVTVHYLRSQLRAAGIPKNTVETTGQSYVLQGKTVWLDLDAFERLAAEGAALQHEQQWDKALHCYEEAKNLYRGDYMEEDIYADWCTPERERLLEIYLEMLAGIAECFTEMEHFAEAAQICRTALAHDPGRESFHRALMGHLVQLGRHDWAIAQYYICRRFLADELGVEPMPDTQRLYHQIIERQGQSPTKKLSVRPGE